MSSTTRYKGTLDSLMSFVHGREVGSEYAWDHVYTIAELNSITPIDVKRWMCLKAYGSADPEDGANPTLCRSNSLKYWKKALSFFMPNRLMEWSTTREEGNPTRSVEVNALIKAVKRKEARKQGAESHTRRPMTEREFCVLHDVLKQGNVGNDIWRYGMAALINYQFHMIARIDDTTQVVLAHIRVHDFFPNVLKTKLNWSKNVEDERDAPWQIMLGSMNPVYCVMCSLALWLETNLRNNPAAMLSPYVFSFCDDVRIPSGGRKAKDIAQHIFGQKVFKQEEFIAAEGGMLGSHSIRKYAATHARRCGVTKDEKDIRGRWKGKGRVSDVYDDVELPYPDAKVAEKLCIGGPCYYMWSDIDDSTSEMMNAFVLTHVVPNIRRRLPDSATIVLGKALLWLIFSPVANNFVSTEFRDGVKGEMQNLLGRNHAARMEDDWNPIRKMPVVVSGDQGLVYIDEVGDVLDVNGNGIANNGQGIGRGEQASIRSQILAMQASIFSMRRDQMELKADIGGVRILVEQGFRVVNGNVRRIALQPARRVMGSGETTTVMNADEHSTAAAVLAMMNNAVLIPTPRSLHDLWCEYQHGIGGRKAARLFSHSERGRVKYKYSRRKVVWDLIAKLVRAGHTADAAIDMIHAAYGGSSSVTAIINGLKRDKKNGTLSSNLEI